MTMAATSKLSFTVRKPDDNKTSDKFKLPALPRHISSTASSASGTPLTGSPRTFSSREDSDDEDSGIVFADGGRKDEPDSSDDSDRHPEDELITSFNKSGAQRVNGKKQKPPAGPLVIPAKANPDWREAARKRRVGATRFIPDSAKASIGADGSVGGLGTRDSINSGPQLSGLQQVIRVKTTTESTTTNEETDMNVEERMDVQVVEETEDQKALRALLAGDTDSAPQIDDIPVPPSETDALQQDVAALPDVASAEDYARVPITAFGAAMLRGMGWVDGGAVTSSEKFKKNALIEPYLPKSRPALLGIGAKEQEVLDDGSKKKKRRGDEKRYIPVVRKESSREGSGGGSTTVSRRASQSPERRSRGERSKRGDSEKRRDDDRSMSRREDDRNGRRNHDSDYRRDRDGDDRSRRRNDNDRWDKDKNGRQRDYDRDRRRHRDKEGESRRGDRERRD